jgi:hypothetical protein
VLKHFDSLSGLQWKPSPKPNLRRHGATAGDGSPRAIVGTRRRVLSTRARGEFPTPTGRNEGEIQRIVETMSGAEAGVMRRNGSAAGASAASIIGRPVPDNTGSSGGRGRWVPRRPPPTAG